MGRPAAILALICLLLSPAAGTAGEKLALSKAMRWPKKKPGLYRLGR
jgi:hypothetical protein